MTGLGLGTDRSHRDDQKKTEQSEAWKKLTAGKIVGAQHASSKAMPEGTRLKRSVECQCCEERRPTSKSSTQRWKSASGKRTKFQVAVDR
jgi:hypothetical protein